MDVPVVRDQVVPYDAAALRPAHDPRPAPLHLVVFECAGASILHQNANPARMECVVYNLLRRRRTKKKNKKKKKKKKKKKTKKKKTKKKKKKKAACGQFKSVQVSSRRTQRESESESESEKEGEIEGQRERERRTRGLPSVHTVRHAPAVDSLTSLFSKHPSPLSLTMSPLTSARVTWLPSTVGLPLLRTWMPYLQ